MSFAFANWGLARESPAEVRYRIGKPSLDRIAFRAGPAHCIASLETPGALSKGGVESRSTRVKQFVTLTSSQSSATVVLKLGPKAGVLLPTVKDKFTGEPVTDFQVSWTILDSDEASSISGGETIGQETRRTIVPPEKYLVLTISARGYKKWIYHDPSDPSRPAFIRFQPGEEKELLVELEPQAP